MYSRFICTSNGVLFVLYRKHTQRWKPIIRMRDRSWEELPQHLTYMKEKGAAAVRSGTCHHNSVGLFSSHRRRACLSATACFLRQR